VVWCIWSLGLLCIVGSDFGSLGVRMNMIDIWHVLSLSLLPTLALKVF
jgi:hypothetical protein